MGQGNNRGRAQVRRGYRAEKRVEALLGGRYERQPLSGRLGGRLGGDLVCVCGKNDCPALRLEVKRRVGGMVTLRRWLGQGFPPADALVLVPAGGEEPVVAMRLSVFCRLVAKAHGGEAEQ